jgi:NADH-quinone oxidoreductase subunit N
MSFTEIMLPLLPETVLVCTALAMLGIAALKRASTTKEGVNAWMAAMGVLLAGLAAWFMPDSAPSTPLLVSDSLASTVRGAVLGCGLIAVLLPAAAGEIRHRAEYRALMLFALTGLLLAVRTNHLLMMFVALELASLTQYLLTGFSRSARASEAALKYFLFGAVSASFLLFGLSLVYGAGHTLDFIALQSVSQSPMLIVGLAMALVGLGFKLAAVPFHAWAPDVYQGASAPVVALVAGASKIAGAAILLRFLAVGFPGHAGSASWGGMLAGWSPWLAVLAVASMVAGNILALAQNSVRRLLAYSAIANTGYFFVPLASGSEEAISGALFYVTVYAVATLGALAVTSGVERANGQDSREAFAGLIKRSPMQAVALLICLASLAGVPPLAGFIGKFTMFSQTLKSGMSHGNAGLAWLVAIAVAMSALSLYYYLLVLKQAFASSAEAQHAATLPLGHRLAILLPSAVLLLIGLFPSLLLSPISSAVRALLDGPS